MKMTYQNVLFLIQGMFIADYYIFKKIFISALINSFLPVFFIVLWLVEISYILLCCWIMQKYHSILIRLLVFFLRYTYISSSLSFILFSRHSYSLPVIFILFFHHSNSLFAPFLFSLLVIFCSLFVFSFSVIFFK